MREGKVEMRERERERERENYKNNCVGYPRVRGIQLQSHI
jgi:hypothetical protein